jgi:hypothetical protein
MKTSKLNVMAMSFAALVTASIAQSKFSGIYSGSVSSGGSFVAAATKGGRVLGLDSRSNGLREALDPAKSTINAAGKLKAASNSGTSVTATVYPDFTIKGTIKVDGKTVRITGRRTFN